MLSLKDKNVLITGGAGFIGSHLVDQIVMKKPHRIIVIDNLFLGNEDNLVNARRSYPELVFLEKDASVESEMESVLKRYQIDVVFNLAVIPLPTSLVKPKWSVDHNIKITTTWCELARKGHYQTLIHFSSSEAYGTAQTVPMDESHVLAPLTPYAASKAADDFVVLSFIETFGIDAAIIRPFNNYGPRQNDKSYAGIIPIVITKVLTNKPVEIHGDGQQTRDFIYATDTANAAIDCFEHSETRGKITNIASGIEISINELVSLLLKKMNAEKHDVINIDRRPGDVRRHCADITKAKKLFQFTQRVDIENGLNLTIDWYLRKRGLA